MFSTGSQMRTAAASGSNSQMIEDSEGRGISTDTTNKVQMEGSFRARGITEKKSEVLTYTLAQYI